MQLSKVANDMMPQALNGPLSGHAWRDSLFLLTIDMASHLSDHTGGVGCRKRSPLPHVLVEDMCMSRRSDMLLSRVRAPVVA